MRAYFRKKPFKWVPKVEDNVKLFKKRLRKCEAHINKHYDVDGLCRAFPQRIEALIASGATGCVIELGLRKMIAGTELSGVFHLMSWDPCVREHARVDGWRRV